MGDKTMTPAFPMEKKPPEREKSAFAAAEAEKLVERAEILRKYDRDKGAETTLRQAIDLDPRYAKAHFRLGVLLGDMERLEEAETEYRETIRLDPQYADAHHNLGLLLRKTGRQEEGEREQAIARSLRNTPK